MQVKGACEKLKEETNAKDEHIRKMLKEMADRYYSWIILRALIVYQVLIIRQGLRGNDLFYIVNEIKLKNNLPILL